MAVERLVSPAAQAVEVDQPDLNWSLRPTNMAEYVGQPELLERLSISIEAARLRKEPMEHVLLHGPPGLGKTTLAHVIAQEMGTKLHLTSGPALTRPTDLVGVLTQLQKGDVLFIDEVHRVPIAVEEFVYPAMEDFRIDVKTDSGMHAQTIQIDVQPFTLIGATTRAGLVSSPMRSRFGIAHNLRFYTPEELLTILSRSCRLLSVSATGKSGEAALAHIASRSRGTPRIANRLLRWIRDFSSVRGEGVVSSAVVADALKLEGIDERGLDELDRKYLRTIAGVYKGGPVGLEAVAATLNEDSGTLEDVVEPYLLQIGFLARTRRGRALTAAGAKHIGMPSAVAVELEKDGALFEG
ncbi:MAG: Holliday junction branch migration DNA helicase RuvB [Phycisphaerales bacterium]|nr:Holliday junction branch migration DNA helicase RuvB [Phycisphaerales bacterium]